MAAIVREQYRVAGVTYDDLGEAAHHAIGKGNITIVKPIAVGFNDDSRFDWSVKQAAYNVFLFISAGRD